MYLQQHFQFGCFFIYVSVSNLCFTIGGGYLRTLASPLLAPWKLSSSCSTRAVQVNHSSDQHAVAKHGSVCSKQNPIAWCIFSRNQAGYCFFDKNTYHDSLFPHWPGFLPWMLESLVCVRLRALVHVCRCNPKRLTLGNTSYIVLCILQWKQCYFYFLNKELECENELQVTESQRGSFIALEFEQNKSPLDPWAEKKKSSLLCPFLFFWLACLTWQTLTPSKYDGFTTRNYKLMNDCTPSLLN